MDELNTTTEIVTVKEARARLVLVKPLVAHLMNTSKRAGNIRTQLAAMKSSPDPDRLELINQLESLREKFERTIRELNGLGALVKDAEKGLIDFYAWKDNDLIHLCWIHGEETVRFWHGMKDGYSGRLPIDDHEIC